MAEVKEGKHVTIEGVDPEKADGNSASEPTEVPEHRRKVLIAVDGSPASNKAIEWYLEELHHDGNFVVFVHSFELPLMHSYEQIFVSPEMWQNTLKKEADRTAQMEKNLMRKLKIKQISGKFLARGGGKTGEAILGAATEEDVDLIIMGTRGHGNFKRALLGSVSNAVMHHAHCPVLVFRDKNKERTREAKKEKADEGSNDDKDEEHAKKED